MVLAINGIAHQCLTIKELLSNEYIISQKNSLLTDSPQIALTDFSLFINQGEHTVLDINSNSPIQWVGTDSATTCHIVVMYDESMVGFAHIDDPTSTHCIIESLANKLKGEISLCVVGGFQDDNNYSLPISEHLLNYVCTSKDTFNVIYWSTLQLNTKIDDHKKASPLITGGAFNLKKKSFSKASFTYRGPELELRSTWYRTSEKSINIYNQTSNCIEIPYFTFKQDPRFFHLSMATDSFLLNNCSTSPHCEPEYFCQDMRNAFYYMATSCSTVVFGPLKKTVVYYMDSNGKWIKQQ